ncbi:MAG: glycoside hydrolase family 9 protein [Lachnospiraceae bacterium]|nr:glycoside hydrolase family 9 protein [Lachnospiraceae bacterium]
MKIHVNQVGYRTGSPKYAMIASPEKPQGAFYLVNADETTRVELTVSKFGKDSYSEDTLWIADFSQVKTEGRYFIEYYSCNPRSETFEISSNPFASPLHDILRMFYYMRCGVELTEEFAGPYHHKSCHDGSVIRYTDGAVLPPITGGWHDAGDYGRYVSPGAVAVGHLLYAFELFPAKCPALNLPESGNGVSDILNECRFELEWLLKVQFEDGSVSHKLTTERFSDFMMPEEDTAQLYLYQMSSMATADFAAVCALASRIYEPYDVAFAATLKEAALRARDYLYEHPEHTGYRNPPGNMTGWYGDRSDSDERMWMLAETYRLTKDPKDLDELKKLVTDDIDKTTLGWFLVGGFAGLCILFAPPELFPDELTEKFRKAFLERSDKLLAISSQNGYRMAMPLDAFGWGSNMTVMDCSAALIVSTLLSGNPAYAIAAEENVHYLLGRNPLDRSYVTGQGAGAFKNPHNRPTASDGIDDPYPGLVSGGANAHPVDEPAKASIPVGTPPLYCHLDDIGSFSTNEIAIYWNSITAFVFAYFA